jgi:hypothetical protein
MEDRIQFIKHEGKEILFVDCSNCTPNELEKISRLVPSYVTQQPKGSVLLLADFTGAKFDRSAVEHMQQGMVYDRPHLKRSAYYGTDTLPDVFYKHLKTFSQRDLPTFETREEALDWLVKD